LVDPTLTPGQFRRATATAALATIGGQINALPGRFRFSIDDVDATLDDESGRIEIRIDNTAVVMNGHVEIHGISLRH
jgi:hypothetical protein